MDFAICPACGQSVLDDDAVNCPFCGASMKGKPGAKPASAAAAPAKPAAKPAAKPKPADDDLPFDLQANLPQNVVQAAAKETKSRPLQVVCPMCETVGYVPTTAAGATVKCANPKCPMPIFTAPAPEPVAKPVEPKKPQRNLVVLGLITAAVVAAAGGAVYFLAMQPTNTAPKGGGGLLTDDDLKRMREQGKISTTSPSTTESTTGQPDAKKPEPPPVAVGPSIEAMIAAALKQSSDISLSNNRNRSKAYCRRLSAEAHAIAGQVDKALGEIEQLGKVGAELPFYRIGPWVEIFWQAHAMGDAAQATMALDTALKDTAKLPKRGRDQMDVATKLAAALVFAGRDAEARTLIEAHQANDLDGEVSFWLTWIAADRDLKDPEKLIATQPVVPREFPQMAAVSAVVTLHGEPELARKFALGWTDLDAKAEAVAAWAEALMWSQPPAEAASAITSGLTDLMPATAALVLARSARAAAAVGDDTVAKQLLTRAQSTLDEVKPPEPYVIPAREPLIKTRPKFDDMNRRAAAVAAEIAVAPRSLGHDPQAALELALQYARGLGPATPAITTLVAEADAMSSTALRAAIKQELKLRTDDEARQAANEYQRHLTLLQDAAKRRFAVQSTIMSRAARLGLGEQTWLVASSRAVEADPNQQEPYLQTGATDYAAWLLEAFRTSRQADLEKAVLAALGGKAPARPVPAVYRELVAAGAFDKAWGALSQQGVRADVQEALVLESAVKLAAKEPLSSVWSMLGPVSNKVLGEQALEGAALIAARNGHGAAIVKQIANVTPTTEIVALNRGLVAGLTDAAASK